MKLEELALHHLMPFIHMVNDYQKNDPVEFDRLYGREWNAASFRAFVKECEAQRLDWRPGPKKISLTRYVLLDEQGEICGNGRMRFPLDEKTEKDGGNLEFDVPPSKRRQGYGALTLNRMLFEAVRAGLARVLITCPSQNSGAIQCVLKNRGELQDEISVGQQKISRFWIRLRGHVKDQ